MSDQDLPIVFSPDNEPYLGRELLFHFDQLISATLELNSLVAPATHKIKLTNAQEMACQLIPQSISIALSIRELVRQGYLFGAQVLLRPLAERATTLLYLLLFPAEINKWDHGWNHREAPSFGKMIESINKQNGNPQASSANQITSRMNSLIHGKPDSAQWNMIPIGATGLGQASSKILARPDLCDIICADTIPLLALVQAMINGYFPGVPNA